MIKVLQTSNYYCHKAEDELESAVDCGADKAREHHLDNAAEFVALAKESAQQLAGIAPIRPASPES